jgi:hypothetical protein
MVKKCSKWLPPLFALLVSCTGHQDIPFDVDTVNGTCSVRAGDRTLESIGMEANGFSILKGAYLFREPDRLVAINSSGKLDFITVFKGDSCQGTVQQYVVNTAEENQPVTRFRLIGLQLKGGMTVASMNERHLDLAVRGNPSETISIQTDRSSPWVSFFCEKNDTLACWLDLAGSTIVLLPEEKVQLPAMDFFFHLCPQ